MQVCMEETFFGAVDILTRKMLNSAELCCWYGSVVEPAGAGVKPAVASR